MNKKTQKEVWNNIAEDWHVFRQKAPIEVEEFLKDKTGNILDLGCGSGRCFIENSKQKLYAVDFSKEMLKFAEKNAKKLEIDALIGYMESAKLEFEDNFFDAGICISVLHCIEGEECRNNTLKELYRVLKPQANAMISVWNKEKSKAFKEFKGKEGFFEWNNRETGEKFMRYYYFYEREELKKILEKIGFKVLDMRDRKESKHAKKNLIVYVEKDINTLDINKL